MNEYELMYVISPRLAAEEVDSTIGRIQGLIESSGGEVMMTDNWGRRRLAYPIKHHFEGTYVLSHLRLASDRIAPFERALHISEDVLRHLLTRGIIPDYHGPPEQELVEARRQAPFASRRDAAPPEDAPAEGAAEEGAAGGDAPAEGAAAEGAPEAAPAPATAEAPADAPAPQAAEDAAAEDAAAEDAPAPQATEEPSPATASAE